MWDGLGGLNSGLIELMFKHLNIPESDRGWLLSKIIIYSSERANSGEK